MPNVPTENDAARADIYKTTIIMAYCAANGLLVFFSFSQNTDCPKAAAQPAPAMIDHLVPIRILLAQVSIYKFCGVQQVYIDNSSDEKYSASGWYYYSLCHSAIQRRHHAYRRCMYVLSLDSQHSY